MADVTKAARKGTETHRLAFVIQEVQLPQRYQ